MLHGNSPVMEKEPFQGLRHHEQFTPQPLIPGIELHPNQFTSVPSSSTQLGLLPSPNIQHHQPPPTLHRSSTVPAHGFIPRHEHVPSLDRSGSWVEGIPHPQYTPQNQFQASRSRGNRYDYRQNKYKPPPVPQINNALHFPPLGTIPAQPHQPPPLSERHQPMHMNNHRRNSGPGQFQHEKHYSPPHNRNTQFHGRPGQPQNFSPPMNRRGRGHHAYRGSHVSRGSRNFIPLDYTMMTEYATSVVQHVRPTESELVMKDTILRRISDICNNLVPGSRVVPFGSLVSGFATKGADMDVIFSHDTIEPQPSSMDSNIPIRLANEFLKRGFEVDLLIRTRVPILKVKTPSPGLEPGSRPSSPSAEHVLKETIEEDPWPENISCDIGFKNHLGITNSHFLRTYSQCDPRFGEMVLFIKQWSKNRDLNSPYFGTLSSYGYVLMVAHFLINIVQPPVLPNLQLIPPEPDTPLSEVSQDGYNIWYFKDLSRIESGDLLPGGKNEMSLGQLIHEFFQYYTTNFNFVSEVVTIRTPGGVMYKQEKGWTSARERVGEMTTYQDRYLLALEDPFEISHNVGRTCGGAGVRRIRGEMQRAAQMIRKLSTPFLHENAGRHAGWDMPISFDELMATIRQHNRGFRNRKNNQKHLVEWIKNGWTVGHCLAQIEAAAEELRRKRELGLPDDAELPPESEEGSGETDGEEEEETDSSDDSAVRVVVDTSPSSDQIVEGLTNFTI
ncbi:hypothetical protein TWF694_000060 [Orbilia ellipsospora]|uniref:polynucleotide adenylyltransferase n=1 Tax=Orbilia ellipsospora TaxID=2528407 RepID=A0AAV9XMV4_9PEZI